MNPVFQELADKYKEREQECDSCHASEPIFTDEIGKLPKPRAEQRSTSVNCMVCHMDAEGNMHGPEPTRGLPFHGISVEK